MSYLCIKKQEPTAGAKGIMCGGVFLPIESYESDPPTPASQIPSDGLALYVPLSEAPSGFDGWIESGAITYKTVDGVPCADFNGSNSNVLESSFQFEATEFTVSIVFNARSFTPERSYTPYLFNFGTSNSDSSRLALRLDNYWNKNGLAMVYNGAYLVAQNLSVNKWYSAQIKFDGAEMSLYLDGELQLKQSVSAMTIDDGLFVGRSPNADNAFNGYLSSLRAYNRALTDSEIKLLAREFMFNSAPVEGKKGILIPSGEALAVPPANGLVFNASYAEDMTDSDGESPVDGSGYTIVEDAAGFKCLNVEKSNMQDSMYYDGTQEKMQFGTGNFAVGFYLKSVKPWSDYNGIILATALADSGFTGFVFYKNRDSGKKSMVVRFGTGTDIYSGSDVDTNWHHWLFMRDGDTVKIYKDGKVDATKAYSGTVNAHEDLYIGGYYSNWSSFTSAYFRLSNVRIYNRALTEAEIQSVACEHNPAKKLFIPLQTAYGTPQIGQKGIIVRSSQVLGHLGAYSKSAETMPTDGLVFYAPLEEEASAAETGQALTVANGTPVYTTYKGVPCAKMENARITFPATGLPTTTFTISAWYYHVAGSGYRSFFGWGYDSSYRACVLQDHDGKLAVERAGGREDTTFALSGWVCCTMTYNNGTCNIYANGELVKTFTMTLNLSSPDSGTIGGWIRDNQVADFACNGYVAACRIYNRALSDAEIKLLAGEYKQEEIKKMFIAVKEQSAIPDDGLIFYAPLQEDKSTAETEQALTKNGTITYQTYKGIPCAHFSSAYISSQLSDYITPYPMTFAIWAAPDTTDSRALWSFSNDKPLMYWNGSYHVYDPDCNVSTANVGDWHHIAWSINSDRSSTYYFDGVAMGTTTSNNTSTIKSLCIGYRNGYQPQWVGYLGGFRIYNRALSADEISALANEYTPEA